MNSRDTYDLYAPPDYWRLSSLQKEAICNGCGPNSWKIDIVPDNPLGIPFREPCNIHDYMYYVGKTHEDKEVADRVFLNNMMRVIQAHAKTLDDIDRGQWIASLYYEAVRLAGGQAFWEGKNKIEEVCAFQVTNLPLFLEVE